MMCTPGVSGGSFILFPIPARKLFLLADTAAYKHLGGANAWSGFSLDEDKGVLFAPVGSPVSISMAAAVSVMICSPIA